MYYFIEKTRNKEYSQKIITCTLFNYLVQVNLNFYVFQIKTPLPPFGHFVDHSLTAPF